MKKLTELLEHIEVTGSGGNLPDEVSDIAADSRRVKEGGVFVALKGGTFDGGDYIKDALKSGAALVVSDGAETKVRNTGAPYVIVKNAREAYAFMAANYFDNPARDMRFVGVSGTNGKTTIAHMIYHILSSNGIKTGLSGTIGNIIGGERFPTDMTTPDPYEFFGMLKKMRGAGTEVVVSEVSAHAVYLKKINPVIADVAVFTNCSQDHLDFFKTMEKYAEVKRSYFTKKHARSVVINADDRVGVEIINGSDARVVSYGIKNPADVFAVNIRLAASGASFFVNLFDDVESVRIPLTGLFNVYNALAAMTAARLLNVSARDSAESLSTLPEIPGRFNIVSAEKCDFVIDYAHSPDGLKQILTAARGITRGKVICVFGCGGDRDKKKRPLMGRIAAEYADFTVLTSDNPRFEEPDAIISDIESGIKGINARYMNIIDRESAIRKAYETAEKNDLIVVAGKGAENYMEIKGIKYDYGDRETVEKIIGKYAT
ncbi:MAG: UDP-N-acetylmuramoyl-L-alanyl-D-glutamate--2,6-diaminopimelate ligase [Clostridiales bacterium]|nr:UDP-N-acetylmuramoyl-L-alanyl-D-glutamate--2,6-diaminopimelate ligase [Clostridiales bacterium]